MNADDLFSIARNNVPDPNNPKPGDTYENVVNYGMFKITTKIVVIDSKSNQTRAYINGEVKYIENFEYLIRSMPAIKPILNSLVESSSK